VMMILTWPPVRGDESASSSHSFVTMCPHQQKAMLRLMILLRLEK
jgi:hypothetical protein